MNSKPELPYSPREDDEWTRDDYELEDEDDFDISKLTDPDPAATPREETEEQQQPGPGSEPMSSGIYEENEERHHQEAEEQEREEEQRKYDREKDVEIDTKRRAVSFPVAVVESETFRKLTPFVRCIYHELRYYAINYGYIQTFDVGEFCAFAFPTHTGVNKNKIVYKVLDAIRTLVKARLLLIDGNTLYARHTIANLSWAKNRNAFTKLSRLTRLFSGPVRDCIRFEGDTREYEVDQARKPADRHGVNSPVEMQGKYPAKSNSEWYKYLYKNAEEDLDYLERRAARTYGERR